MDELQTSFNEDGMELLVEDGMIENATGGEEK